MGMYVVKTYGNFLCEGRWDKSCNFFCPDWGDLERAKLFESRAQMLEWLRTQTNYQPWRLEKEHPGYALVSYADEAAVLITRLLERMA